MTPIKLKGQISNGGKLVLYEPDLLQSFLRKYAGKELELKLSSPKEPKTQEQLGYYFAHVVPTIAEHLGYDPVEMYGLLKSKYMPSLLREDGTMPLGLSDMTKDETAKFIKHCVGFGVELGSDITPPGAYGG
jgi:hypothetical protein